MTTTPSFHNLPTTPPAPPQPSTPARRDDGPWTAERIRELGVVTDLPTAAKVFGLGRALAYQLARDGQFPVPVLRVGNRYRVAVAAILAALHLPTAPDTVTDPVTEPDRSGGSGSVDDLIVPPQSSVDHHDEIRRSGPQPLRAAPTRGVP
ncbi:hypothetical protein GCM10020218_068090 [Dactylosporangium vinaceum]|uniref:DNA-binding protein n=1 Tax=Dactylosporangium vinaceum TaxID=53362 RepID=A0ABV5M2K9_9ACTN|nr:hypothetical protein [Dactylosporangium vinaceum]